MKAERSEIRTGGGVGGGFDNIEPTPLNRHQRSESNPHHHQVTTTFGGFGSEIDEEEDSNEIPMPVTSSHQTRNRRSNSNAMKSIESSDSISKNLTGEEKDLEDLHHVENLPYNRYGNDDSFDTTLGSQDLNGKNHPFDDSFGSTAVGSSSSPVKSNLSHSSPTASPRRINDGLQVNSLRYGSNNPASGVTFTREVVVQADDASSLNRE